MMKDKYGTDPEYDYCETIETIDSQFNKHEQEYFDADNDEENFGYSYYES